MALGFTSNLVGLAVLILILLLNPEGSSRAIGMPLERLAESGYVAAGIALFTSLFMTGVGFLMWRDWRKRGVKESDATWFRSSIALLVWCVILHSFLLTTLCVPAVLVDVISA